jgi:hypothetical protein
VSTELAVTRPEVIARAVDAVQALATELGRDDLGRRLLVAAARVRRPATIICVVGEFKQGKSSLVNALLDQMVCPVDDDIATSALTLLRYGAEQRVEVRRRVDDRIVVEEIDPAALDDWASERGNPDNVKCVERVDISLPHRLLANGLAIVDTPGTGGLGGHGAAILAFLPFADGLVFVTDASAELSAPEAEFLDRATELCPNVIFVLSKTDLYPAWRQIASIDEHHRRDATRPILPVSSSLFGTEAEPGDETLAEASGIPTLLAALDEWIVDPAKDVAAERAAAETNGVLDQLERLLRTELDVLENPTRQSEIVAHLADATARLEQLRGPGSRWSIVVADRLADLSNDSGHRFRTAMRTVLRETEEAIESLKTGDDWDRLAQQLQTDVAGAVADVFVGIERGAQATREIVVELIGADLADLADRSSARDRIELSSLWTDKSIDPTARQGATQMGSALTGMKGAQSGIIMFGMMGRFLPAGAAALMMSNPVTIGIGAAFAGMQLAEANRRKIALRRQQARANVRQFMDDVQFAVGHEIGEVMRDAQRGIRDEFTERFSELARTYSEAAQHAQQATEQESGRAVQRAAALRSTLERVERERSSLPGGAAS